MHTLSQPRKHSALFHRRTRWLIVIGLMMAILPQWATHAQAAALDTPTAQTSPVVEPAPSAVSVGKVRYFSQTAHFLRGAFLSYWETHGGTAVLGLPITEPIVEDGLTVQYLERARLEWHPEISNNPGQAILLTRLGVVASEQRGLQFTPIASGGDTFTSHFFTETGHNLANAFLTYWQKNGGLAVFGYPISEEFAEVNQSDGQTYTVQYFERNRFEWHPELKPPSNIQLGLLGVEYARTSNLDPLARVLLPAEITASDGDLSADPRLDTLVDPSLLPVVQELGQTPEFRWVPAVIIENSIDVTFDNIDEEGVAGSFYYTGGRSPRYYIVISNAFKDAGDLAIGSILAHEATHAYDTSGGAPSSTSSCSVEEELRAYMNGLAAWIVLGGRDALEQSYTPSSPEDDINRSLVAFNDDNTQLQFDVNVQAGRSFLTDLYGPTCGK